jgi:acyl-CoA thioesterase YciA
MSQTEKPKGELVIQTIAMPRDVNRNGDIFGGWLVSQMDLGGAILASKISKARVVTVAMEGMSFLHPVRVGDTVACYARVEKIGTSSMRIPIEVWANRFMTDEELRVTEAVFVYVAVDAAGKPIPVRGKA